MESHGHYSVTGWEHLDKVFLSLPRVIRERVLRRGVRAGAQMIMERARQLAPVKSGFLRDSLQLVDSGSGTDRDHTGANVVSNAQFFKARGLDFYAGFVEYGHRVKGDPQAFYSAGTHRVTDPRVGAFAPRGSSASLVPGQHFLRRAVEQRGEAARQLANQIIRIEIEREADLLGARGRGGDASFETGAGELVRIRRGFGMNVTNTVNAGGFASRRSSFD